MNVDKKIQVTQAKINRVRKWLKIVRRAWHRAVKKQGLTKDLARQKAVIERDVKDLQDCQNELNVCKAERKLQKRFMKKTE